METTFDYLRAHAGELGACTLKTYPPLQGPRDVHNAAIATLLRKALPAEALAITGTAKFLRKARAARIVAECGAGKTFMALGKGGAGSFAFGRGHCFPFLARC